MTKPARARSNTRKEKALPKSPRKKTKICDSLAKKYQLRIVMNKKKGRKAKQLTDKEKQWIRYSLDRVDLTYVNPERKVHVYIGKKDGEWQYCQKRYLLWNLRDLLNILMETKSLVPLQELKHLLTDLKSFYLSRYFTLSSEITNNSFITRTLRKDCASVRCVKILSLHSNLLFSERKYPMKSKKLVYFLLII